MAQTSSINALSYLQSRPLPPLATLAVFVAVVVVSWSERRKSRIALGHLDNRLLDDIGLTQAQARFECERPFWEY